MVKKTGWVKIHMWLSVRIVDTEFFIRKERENFYSMMQDEVIKNNEYDD